MQRRVFLKKSAIGIGTLAGFHGGILNAKEVLGGQAADENAHSRGGLAEDGGAWGINAAVLGSPWEQTPSPDEMLADTQHTLILSRFLCVGGENRPATPTECRVATTSDTLLVLFRCKERDMSFPYANLDPKEWQEANWHSLPGLPSGSGTNWPPNPDEVDILVQPDTGAPSYYQFAATPQGLKFGCNRVIPANKDASANQVASSENPPVHVTAVDAFEASVTKRGDEWLVYIQVPWQTLGGKPPSHFGILPMRTRWRDGEFSSPVALDLNECLPIDLLIETHFQGSGRVEKSESSVCRLPSGILRWQRQAVLTYPDVEAQRQIWRMQSSLSVPTDEKTLDERLTMAQRWIDMMMQEGFTPLPRAWGDLDFDLTQAFFRQRVNLALQQNDVEEACRSTDTYLNQLDKMSRWWYADGSAGNIRKDEWKPVTSAQSLELQGNVLLMRCTAGGHAIDLHLALPAKGGVRVYGRDEGYWRPDDLLPIDLQRAADSYRIETGEGWIVIRQKPFSIAFVDGQEKQITQIDEVSLAFRFGSDEQVAGIDYRNRLDQDEVIYGFGEKYDAFNHAGSVLTLWGTDDWVGNGLGAANTTYKPLPIFHSSKGYMVFDNSSYRLRADIGKTNPQQYRITQQGPIFDFYFWIGSPEKRLQSYTALTGTPPLPPKWVFEPWMGRGEGAWAKGPLQDPVAEEQHTALQFAELDIPHSAIYAEGVSALSPVLNQFMAARGIRVLGYFMPAIDPTRQQSLMPELKSDELPVLHCEDKKDTSALGYVDFSNPKSMELCRRALSPALNLGEAGSMVDYGDLVPDSAVFHDGRRGAEMHNAYYYDYQCTISAIFREKRGDDFILYARGAAPGTQRWVGQFAGDHPANFNGLKHVLTGALNLCACGYSNWGSDLGGYFGLPQPAVYMRWFQFGCFSPLMRPHGTAPRDPWYFGEAAVTNYKFLAWTRENILNYTYNAAATAHKTGVSIMRSMPVAFPKEKSIAAISDQYMFGPDLLIAPVLNEDTTRTIIVPSGVWTNLWDGKTIEGPATVKADAPLDTIPVYIRAGATMPVQLSPELQFGKSMSSGRFDALVVTPPAHAFETVILNARGEAARVTVQPKAVGCTWTMENLPEMTYLLIYGTSSAANVRVNGRVLPRMSDEQCGKTTGGWRIDAIGNRLVIGLPSQQAEHSQQIFDIEVDFNASSSRAN